MTLEEDELRLFEAIKNHDLEQVQQVLRNLKRMNRGVNFTQIPEDERLLHSETPLHIAACYGSAEIIKVLINHGANIDAQDSQGWTPLMRAASGLKVDSFKVLVAHGANLDLKHCFGDVAITAMLNCWADVANNTEFPSELCEGCCERLESLSPKVHVLNRMPCADCHDLSRFRDDSVEKVATLVSLFIEAGANLELAGRFGDKPIEIIEGYYANTDLMRFVRASRVTSISLYRATPDGESL